MSYWENRDDQRILFTAGSKLFALNARTGERAWHYQFVKHDLWDRDLPSPPNLIDWRVNDERIPAVAQATKTGHIFVTDRASGKPLTPIRQTPVVGKAIAGDVSAAWQPLPDFPTFTQQTFTPSSRTPADGASVHGLHNLSERMSLWSTWQLINKGRGRMPGFDNMPALAKASVLYYVWTADESTEACPSRALQRPARIC